MWDEEGVQFEVANEKVFGAVVDDVVALEDSHKEYEYQDNVEEAKKVVNEMVKMKNDK